MADRIGRRTSTEQQMVVIRRSFWSKFISLLGFWPWVVLCINDFLKIVDLSALINSEFVLSIKASLGLGDEISHFVLCGAVAVFDLVTFLIIAYLRSRMRTYIYTDTMVYIPAWNPRANTRARSFVGVYQANVLPASGFFLVVWVKSIRRLIRGYRDIVISCPGSQSDGTIIIRGVADYNNVLAQINALRVSESTNVAYTKPTPSSYTAK